MSIRTGRVYYSDTHMVVQEEGKATATLSSLTYHPNGQVIMRPVTYLSLFDAMNVAAIEGDQDFAAHLLRETTS